jgi:hypothetical protein
MQTIFSVRRHQRRDDPRQRTVRAGETARRPIVAGVFLVPETATS